MLSIRVFHLLAVGFCLFLIARYMRFMQVTVHGLDRLMTGRFFDVDGLTREIRGRLRRQRETAPGLAATAERLIRAVFLWLCRRLRRAAGLD